MNRRLMIVAAAMMLTAVSAMGIGWPGYWCKTRPDTACSVTGGGPGGWTCSQTRYTGCNNCDGGIWPTCTGAAVCTATDWTGTSATGPANCNGACTIAGAPRLVVSACT